MGEIIKLSLASKIIKERTRRMLKNNIKKIMSIMLASITILLNMTTLVQAATDITSADITYVKDCGSHLQAKDENGWYTIVASYVEYTAPNGKKYPAYCLDNTKPGVGNASIGDLPEGYTVNVTKLLDNNKVYTAAINGYPYKTPEELGVKNKYDAYIATKQAIYSVLYGYDVDERYKGVDDRGKNIKSAIKKIVKIAREQTKTQSSALIKLNKVGNLVEDRINSEYYSQTYKVSSDVSMKSYTITSIKNFTKNTIITDINNKKKSTFQANEQFKILIPKSEVLSQTDINGTINAKMQCKTYPVFYGSKGSKLQPYALTYDAYGDNLASTNLQAKMNTGKLQVHKIDNKTKTPIEGVTFELKKTDGTVVGTKTTDKDGMATFTNLYEGKYQLQEIETKEEYNINTTPFEVEVRYNKTTQIEVENELKQGQIKVIKVDADNAEIKLKDVEFVILDTNGNILETIKTDENGEAVTQKYMLKDFQELTIRETKTQEGYILNQALQTITLKPNEIIEITLSNQKIPEQPKEPEPPKKTEKPKVPEQPKKLPRTGF